MLVRLIIVLVFLLSGALSAAVSTPNSYLESDPIVVPPGNGGTNLLRSDTNWRKYRSILDLLTQPNYGCVVLQAAEAYDLDPVSILGSIIGEHTYNVNHWDYLQSGYVRMKKKWLTRFYQVEGVGLSELLKEDQYALCESQTDNKFDLWNCYDDVWIRDARNRAPKGYYRMKWTFFDPMGAGFTYGLGQLGPQRALMVTDIVHENSGFEILSIEDPESIYDHILDPRKSIHYVAATNRVSIKAYKEFANFDISQNPGVIATLYNLGKEKQKAESKYRANISSLKKGKGLIYPAVNSYGWMVNYKADEIRETFQKKVRTLPAATCAEFIL